MRKETKKIPWDLLFSKGILLEVDFNPVAIWELRKELRIGSWYALSEWIQKLEREAGIPPEFWISPTADTLHTWFVDGAIPCIKYILICYLLKISSNYFFTVKNTKTGEIWVGSDHGFFDREVWRPSFFNFVQWWHDVRIVLGKKPPQAHGISTQKCEGSPDIDLCNLLEMVRHDYRVVSHYLTDMNVIPFYPEDVTLRKKLVKKDRLLQEAKEKMEGWQNQLAEATNTIQRLRAQIKILQDMNDHLGYLNGKLQKK